MTKLDLTALVWAFIEESLASAGFATRCEVGGSRWNWRWVVKDGVLLNEKLWVGHELRNLNLINVGRTTAIKIGGKVIGTVNVADPEAAPKLLAWLDNGIKLIYEHPELFR